VTAHVERAHAKINLVLHILEREASGYHGIETLFQRLMLHDVVTVRVGGSDRTLACDGPAMPSDGLGPVENNLAWRAAALYAQESSWETGWEISIDKQIPVGGGLGGGSADAAAVLRAMDALSPSPLGTSRLLEMGSALGADVPFLVTGASMAWGWGRGDRLMLLPALPSVAVTLFTFPDGVNTGAAYAAFAAMRERNGASVASEVYDVEALASWENVARIAANDFEQVVPSMHAGVADVLPIIQRMAVEARQRRGTNIAQLSGSGATCFLLDADGASLPREFPSHWRMLTTHTA
jgi:4-diphosphocytidyl-2-C-methyl-D-erythritol kinase